MVPPRRADGAELLFCDNESNAARLWGADDTTPFPKDGIADHVVHGTPTVNPDGEGTKAAAHVRLVVPAGGPARRGVRLTARRPTTLADPFADADDVVAARRAEADEFYAAITPAARRRRRARSVMRQALAGMLWSKQSLLLRPRHLAARAPGRTRCASPQRRGTRNESWFHMVNHDVISMPDTWEYPWYAAWDLAFHCLPLAMVDPDFAKRQLDLMLSQVYLHPTGQMPAYEWNFGDVNPPVHAFATLFMHSVAGHLGDVDLPFLRAVVHPAAAQLHVVGQPQGPRPASNVFEGGFLGLDNIGVFDRSAPLPTGGRLEQADGTAWMALFSQNMLELALALAEHDDPDYDDFVLKFVEHFFWIAAAVDPIGEHPDEMWDDEDGFFYDVLRLPDGTGAAAQGALARRAAAAVRHDGHRGRACSSATPSWPRAIAQLPRAQPRPARQHRRPARARRQRPAPAVARQRGQAAPDPRPGCSTRSASSGPTASARSRAPTSTSPTSSRSTASTLPRAVRAGRVDHAGCSAATRTGAGRCGSRSTC